MEKVQAIGGMFFRSRDQEALARWYREHLGVTPVPDNYDEPGWEQQAGPTGFAPFPEDTEYFGDAGKQWMVNFRGDLDAMIGATGSCRSRRGTRSRTLSEWAFCVL